MILLETIQILKPIFLFQKDKQQKKVKNILYSPDLLSN